MSSFIKSMNNISASGSSSTATYTTLTTGTLSATSNITSPAYMDFINGVPWGTSTFSFSSGTNYWMSSGTAQTTTSINFTNLTATAGNSYTFNIILPTTNAAYYYNISTCQVNTSTCTFKSNIGTLTTPTNFIVQTFTCMYLNSTWYVITSASSF